MVSEDWRSIDIDALEPDAHLTKEDLLPTDIPQLPMNKSNKLPIKSDLIYHQDSFNKH